MGPMYESEMGLVMTPARALVTDPMLESARAVVMAPVRVSAMNLHGFCDG